MQRMAAAQCDHWTVTPWPAARAAVLTDSISGTASASAPRNPASNTAAVGGEAGPCRRRDGLRLRDQGSGRGKIAAPGRKGGHRVHPDHQLGEQARLAAGLELAVLDRLPALLAA